MAHWPEIEVKKRGAKKRAGKNVREGAKQVTLVQITVSTVMKCKLEIVITDRVPVASERTEEARMRRGVQTRAYDHIGRCKKGCRG